MTFKKQELFAELFRLFLNENERSKTVKLLYSLFILATLGLLINKLSPSELPLITVSEMREVNRRLDSIKYL